MSHHIQRTYHPDGAAPSPTQIFVFGSNLSGLHGAGAARAAHRLYGAEWGRAEGPSGRTYAIPTVGARISGPLSVDEIAQSVARFVRFAQDRPLWTFLVTRIGCGLAGHKDSDIAPLFAQAPANCSLPDPWREFIEP